MEKAISLSTRTTEELGNPGDLGRTIAVSERALNGAILTSEISRSFEEYVEIFDYFYTEDIQATTETLKEPVQGKCAVRARLAGFLVSTSRIRRDCWRFGVDSVESDQGRSPG